MFFFVAHGEAVLQFAQGGNTRSSGHP
jgi:hypothetical protein